VLKFFDPFWETFKNLCLMNFMKNGSAVLYWIVHYSGQVELRKNENPENRKTEIRFQDFIFSKCW